MTNANCIKGYGTKKLNIFKEIVELKIQIEGTKKKTNTNKNEPTRQIGNCQRYRIENSKLEYELNKLRIN